MMKFRAYGGSWYFLPLFCPTAYRFHVHPDFRDFDYGFRLMLIHKTKW